MTYHELAHLTSRIATLLTSHRRSHSDRIILCVERGPEQIAAVLAILEIGAVCIPVEPGQEHGRTKIIFEDAQPDVVLISAASANLIPAGLNVILMDDIPATTTPAPTGPELDSDCYILFTSGSTGRPKGVRMPHRALANLIEWQACESEGAPATLQLASLTFDVSFQEILSTLCYGGTLVLLDEITRRDPQALLAYVNAQKVERLFLPFVLLQQLAAAAVASGNFPITLRQVNTAGEALRITPDIRAFFLTLPDCQLQNQYGPTETHVVTAWTLTGPANAWPDLPPIGKVLPNVQAFLLDENGQFTESNEGELAIAGVCLASGYFNDEARTTERFVQLALPDAESIRAYRTGDLVRRTANDCLEYLGRADRQVKISGVRIEPGEVESAIAKLPGIAECAVTPFGDAAARRLAAYIVTRKDAGFDEAGWADSLRKILPDVMLPAVWIPLDTLPLTPTGKLDRDRLPQPTRQRPQLAAAYHEPATPTEQALAAIWRDALLISQVGIDDSLFDLGGTSLLVAELQTRIHNALGLDIPVVRFFENPTIRGLASSLEKPEPVLVVAPSRKRNSDEPVAIVGMAGRFPGAANIDEFWCNLRNGVDSISQLSADELEVPHALAEQPGYVKARGILDEVDRFDAPYFGILPSEAALMDPQHRIFLETAVHALEHAGIDPARHAGKIGVIAGLSLNTYLLANIGSDPAALTSLTQQYQAGDYPTLVGNDKDYLATRVAYKLGLRGPAFTVQTGCSTSLVAVILACRSLQSGECDTALAGGVSVSFPQKRGYMHEAGGMVSSDGTCRPFDAAASGTVFGAGAGLVVLRRLSDAIADGDNVLAVIRGTGLNNDGSDKVSFLAPSVAGQADAIAQAHAEAGWSPESIQYVEAHGTATPVGDPMEIRALTRAFRAGTEKKQFCAIGSAKGNVGHLEAAAGVTGLIKTVLALQHGQIPPTPHFQSPNPAIDIEETPFFVAGELLPWEPGGEPRRAGVSSFGVGGTNAHIVLEEPSAASPSEASPHPQLLLVSAKTRTALEASGTRLSTALSRSTPLSDVAFTLQTSRTVFPERAFVVADDHTTAAAALSALKPRTNTRSNPEVCFLFPGQGSQYPLMASGLLAAFPVFRETFETCAGLANGSMGCDLRELTAKDLTSTVVTQSAIFAMSYSLAKQWQAWGVQPSALIGHSLGEYTAACLAGVWNLEDALRLVIGRAQLVDSLEQGAMLVVRMAEAKLAEVLPTALSIAAINSPSLCVISGAPRDLENFEATLKSAGTVTRRLASSRAFHSQMVDPVLPAFRELLKVVTFHPPTLPIRSNLTGNILSTEEAASPEYWVRHLRESVRFTDSIQSTTGMVFLEVGPGNSLTQLARQSGGEESIASLTTDADSEYSALLNAAGKLWQAGIVPDWKSMHAGEIRHRVALPGYPFERHKYWIAPGQAAAAPTILELPETATPKEKVPSDLRSILRALFLELSGVSIPPDRDDATFIGLGFDSLFLTQMRLALQKRLGLQITFRQLIDEVDTLETLTSYAESAGASPVSAAPKSPEREIADTSSTGSIGPFKPMEKLADDLSPQQRASLDEIAARYTTKTTRSKAYATQHRPHFCDPRAAGNFNRTWKEMVYPIVAAKSYGGRIRDIDDNEYIDITLGFGVHFLGHNPPYVLEAAKRQLALGTEIGPQSVLAGHVAKLVCEMVGMERATFCNTGSEAVMAAMRAARTATGRNKIAIFAGDYHGMFDAVLVRAVGTGKDRRTLPVAPGIPQSQVDEIIVLDYCDPASIEELRLHAEDLAAVMVEPVQARYPAKQPKEFLHKLRKFTHDIGAALIFDEVITGFRCSPGGAQEYFGVKADLATYGKIVGGGMPIGVLAGSATFMDVLDGGQWSYGDDSFPEVGVTFFAGTFVRHPLAMAAAEAVLKHLRTCGPSLQDAVNLKAARFTKAVNTHFTEIGAPMHFDHFSSILQLKFDDGFRHAGLFFYLLRDHGIFIWEGRLAFLSVAHTDSDVDQIISAFREAATEMKTGGWFPDAATPRAPFPLTGAQREIWMACHLGGEFARTFNESVSVTFRGALNVTALQSSMEDVIARHEALRTIFDADGSLQTVLNTMPLAWKEESRTEYDAELIAQEEADVRFEPATGPLLRCRLISLDDDSRVLVVTAHHIVCDGWSLNVIFEDLAELYAARIKNHPHTLQDATPFREFYQWERCTAEGADAGRIESYWSRQFQITPPALELPCDFPRPRFRRYGGDRIESTLPEDLHRGLAQLGAAHGCTLFTVMLAGYFATLHRWTRQSDLVAGIPAAGQSRIDGETLTGHCTNLLPLRAAIEPQSSFLDLLLATRKLLLDGYEYQDFTLGRLLELLNFKREPSRAPIVETAFNLETMKIRNRFPDLEVRYDMNRKHFVQFDLFLNACDYGDRIVAGLEFNTSLLRKSTAQSIADSYIALLADGVANPAKPLDQLALLIPEPAITNATRPEPPALLEVFAKICRSHPDKLAISDGDNSINYKELDAWSDAIATELAGQDGQVVGVCMPRSAGMVATWLGIAKAGATYLPLDPEWPRDRITELLRNANADLVLVNNSSLDLPGQQLLPKPGNAKKIQRQRAPDSALYVIYTSGSTGKPKGVAVRDSSVVCLVCNTNYIQLTPTDVIAQASNAAFDAATFEIWGALLNGATLRIITSETLMDPSKLASEFTRHSVTTGFFTTALFNQLALGTRALFPGLRNVLFGGEACNPAAVRSVLEHGKPARLLHVYGPTETTTFATWHLVEAVPENVVTIPIGKAISDTEILILNEHLQIQPPGLPGEICIGGAGVALGYLGDPALTAEKFIPHPFREGGRLYKSGDLGRTLEDGSIEFIGRRDQQIKLRGFRIETGEIEAELGKHPSIKGRTVQLCGEGNQRYLAAYFTAGKSLDEDGLRSFLKKRLPAHMVPARFVQLDALPITVNGKIDTARLPSPPQISASQTPYLLTATEKRLLGIWGKLFQREGIGIDDDFFELGGHSLLALELAVALEKPFGRAFPVSLLFQAPTVREFAKEIDQRITQAGQPASTLVPIQEEGSKPPVFFVHAGDGSILFYRALANLLGPDQPSYGLEAPWLVGSDEIYGTIEEIANAYIAQIKALRPEGPYLLAGFSFGGVAAYEMAKQLRNAGDDVQLLCLFDAYNPAKPPRRLNLDERFEVQREMISGKQKASSIKHLAGRAWGKAAVTWLVQKERLEIAAGRLLKKAGRALPARMRATQARNFHLHALDTYRPGKSDVPMLLFTAETRGDGYHYDHDLGWSSPTREKLEIIPSPGTHDSMLLQPHVRKIAEILRKRL